jgi:hypothetical protein
MSAVDLATLNADTFEPRRQDGFCVGLRDGELELTLAEVKRLGTALREGGAFSLLFVAKTGPALPQAIYRLTHPALGALDIFLVPIGPVAGGAGYEAVFT